MTTTQKKMIWAWPTRAFHWLLALGFIVAFITGESDNLRNIHAAFGLLAGGAVLFRIFYGFTGPMYSRFSDFPLGLNQMKLFFGNLFKSPQTYTGHNPPASMVMLSIIIAGVVTALSGYLAYNQPAWISVDFHAVGEFHEIIAKVFLFLVLAHLAGVISDLLLHGKKAALSSILNGLKDTSDPAVTLKPIHQITGIAMVVFSVLLFTLAVNQKTPQKAIGNRTEANQENEAEDAESDHFDD